MFEKGWLHVITGQHVVIGRVAALMDIFKNFKVFSHIDTIVILEKGLRQKLESNLSAFLSIAPAIHNREANLDAEHPFKVGS